MDFVQTLPTHISKQILAGLEYTKKKMPTDLVATTVGVTGPQVTPPGSPIDGQVAKSAGAPVEKYLTLTIDTSEFDEDQDCVAYIGDSSETHETSCDTCNAGENKATLYIGTPTCNRYSVFLNRLCSTPYTFAAFQIKAQKAAGADSGSVVDLPDHIMFSRKNINGEGDFGRIDVSNFENLEAFPRTDLKYADISLSSAANLFDRDTQWKIPGLVGKRKYTLTIYTGFRGAN